MWYLFLPNTPNNFQTLSQISRYVKTAEEFPSIDNNDRLKPDYSSFLKTITPGLLRTTLQKIIPYVTPKWDIQQFKKL